MRPHHLGIAIAAIAALSFLADSAIAALIGNVR